MALRAFRGLTESLTCAILGGLLGDLEQTREAVAFRRPPLFPRSGRTQNLTARLVHHGQPSSQRRRNSVEAAVGEGGDGQNRRA